MGGIMKIAINNQIIDTESIFSIGDIIKSPSFHFGNTHTVCQCDYKFYIQFYNKESLKIDKHIQVCIEIKTKTKDEIKAEFTENVIHKQLYVDFYRGHHDLVKIWSKNQLKIPKFII